MHRRLQKFPSHPDWNVTQVLSSNSAMGRPDRAQPAWSVIMDRPYTSKEMAKIAAGAVASLVIVGWLVVLAIVFLSAW